MPKRSQTRITDHTVRRKPGDRPIEFRDCDLRGFILRIEPTGTKTFYCEWERGKRSRIGDANLLTLEQARRTARSRINGAKNGEIPEPQIRSRIPKLKKFLDDHYNDWAESSQKSGKANCQRIRAAFSEFQGKRIDKLTPWQIDKWKSDRKRSGTSAATINRDLRMLRAALNKAVDWGLMDSNPIRTVKLLKGGDNSRVRYLSAAETQRLMKALDARESNKRVKRASGNQWRSERGRKQLPTVKGQEYTDHIKPMVLLSLHTGLRFGEITSLIWADVSFGLHPNITVQAAYSKSRKVRHIPLNSTALSVLKTWKGKHVEESDLVFPSPSGGKLTTVKTAWSKLRQEADLTDFNWHDLRHDFASKLVMAGVDLNTTRELLGHGSLQMTLRYAHLAPEHKAAAIELICANE